MQKHGRTLIFRIIHVDNLHIYLKDNGIHAPGFISQNEQDYRSILDPAIHERRCRTEVPCGTGGMLSDYVPFYFGNRSPMLYRLHTGFKVGDYMEGQEPIIYLVSSFETIQEGGNQFVMTDGHALASLSSFSDDAGFLEEIDMETVDAEWWHNTEEDTDRERRKQAELLVYKFCEWSHIFGIAVINDTIKQRVQAIQNQYPEVNHPDIAVRRAWYY